MIVFPGTSGQGFFAHCLADDPLCIGCGLCLEVCPIFTILRQERISSRGLAILTDQDIASKEIP